MWIIYGLTLRVMFAVNGCPLFGHHTGGQPEPEAEEVGWQRMQIQSTMRLATMQKDGHAGNGDMSHHQGKNYDLPPGPVQIAIG